MPWVCNLIVTLNNEKKPFDDVRVRRALTLAIDRWGASKALSQISVMKYVGGLLRPGSEFATPESELVKLAGFGRTSRRARKEARRLLKEAGVPDGFSFTLKNRNVKEPYEMPASTSSINGVRSDSTSITFSRKKELTSMIFARGTTTPGSIFSVTLWTSRICSSSIREQR